MAVACLCLLAPRESKAPTLAAIDSRWCSEMETKGPQICVSLHTSNETTANWGTDLYPSPLDPVRAQAPSDIRLGVSSQGLMDSLVIRGSTSFINL